jgi:flagellar basal-body rod protein FlgF
MSVGKLDIVVPNNSEDLLEATDGNYQCSGETKAAQGCRLIQGALEGSNVKPVDEMAALIELTRSSDIISRVFKTGSDALKMAATEIGRVGN